MGGPLRLLIIEDNEDDTLLLVRHLERAGYQPEWKRVERAEDFLSALAQREWEIVIADYTVPGFGGLAALEILKKSGLDIPFLIVSGTVGEETAVETMKAGAHDYLLKGRLTRLVPAIEREMREASVRRERRRSDAALLEMQAWLQRDKLFLDALLTAIPIPVFYKDAELRYIGCNHAYTEMMGIESEELRGKTVFELWPRELAEVYSRKDNELLHRPGVQSYEAQIRDKTGTLHDVVFSKNVFHNEDGTIGGIVGAYFDITQRKQAEQALLESRTFLDKIIDSIADPIFVKDRAHRWVLLNDALCTFLGCERRQILGKSDYDFFPKEEADVFWATDEKVFTSGEEDINEEHITTADGVVHTISTKKTRYTDEKGEQFIVGIIRDITAHKRAEEHLRAANRQLENIIEFLPDATVIIDQDKRIIAWNRAMEEMSGVPKEEMIGRDHVYASLPFFGKPSPYLIDLIDRDDTELAGKYSFIKRRANTLYAEIFSPALYQGRGAYLWAFASPLYDTDGRVAGGIESVRDITELKQAEESLQMNFERSAALLKLAQMSAASLDEIIEFTFAEAMRLTRSEIGFLGFLNEDESILTVRLWSPDVMPACRVDHPLEFSLSGAGLWAEAVRQRRPIVENDFTAPSSLKRGFPPGHIAIHRYLSVPVVVGAHIVLLAGLANKEHEYDDTDVQQLSLLLEGMWRLVEHRKAEEAILAANERFRSVLRAATTYSIIGTDPEGLIKVFNEGAELLLGYRADEAIDRLHALEIHDSTELAARGAELGIPPGFEVLVAAARRGLTETREWSYIRKDGSRLSVSLSVTALRNETGELTGFIGMARDITAEKKMEQQILQSQKMESVGLLAGGVAHDFNNLLTPILGYTEILLAGFSEGDPRRHHLQEVRQAAERAKDLTQRLLAFSRKQVIELKTVDLGEIVHRFVTMLRRMIREDITIEIDCPATGSPVNADVGQIEQVLLNLSINAQDAMPDGGTLTIEVRGMELDETFCARHPDIAPGAYFMLAVSDSGIGMDEKTLERIFEPFFTTKDPGKGTGLGLSTVYGIVKQHGGTVTVYSELHRGSTFKIFLPRVEKEEEAEAKHPARSEGVARGEETILVIEDNEMVRSLTCNILQRLGYHVLSADHVDGCIQLVKEYTGSIDLLLTDVILPKLNGRELYEQLRAIRPTLKALFMSGYTSDVIGHHGVLEKDLQFIQKPFTLQGLAGKVRGVLDS